MNEVIVLGPNIASSRESFHVHAAGCRDLGKRNYNFVDSDNFQDSTLAEIISAIYFDQINEAVASGEDRDSVIAQWSSDFKVLPCAQAVFSVRAGN